MATVRARGGAKLGGIPDLRAAGFRAMRVPCARPGVLECSPRDSQELARPSDSQTGTPQHGTN